MQYDPQKQTVYKWERNHVNHLDKHMVPFEQIQSIVNFVWQQEGLKYPPVVERVPKQARTYIATGTRTEVRFQERATTVTILHELAHSMTSLHDGYSNYHGANFVGVYCKLLAKYLKTDLDKLFKSAIMSGVEVNKVAIPVF